MAARALLTNYVDIQATGTPGEFRIVGQLYVLDDTNTHPQSALMAAVVNFATMTGLQIQQAIVQNVIDTAASMGFTVSMLNNQIIIPSMVKA